MAVSRAALGEGPGGTVPHRDEEEDEVVSFGEPD